MVERKMEEEKLESMIKGTNNANRSHLPTPDIGDPSKPKPEERVSRKLRICTSTEERAC